MRAKNDCNQLLNSVTPFAERMLREQGGFHPFGAQMLTDGEIVSVAADVGEEFPPATDLIELLRTTFRNGAEAGTLRATATAYDVTVVPPGSEEKSHAIAIELDHRELYSVRVFFPYLLAQDGLSIGAVFANDGRYDIFPAANSQPI